MYNIFKIISSKFLKFYNSFSFVKSYSYIKFVLLNFSNNNKIYLKYTGIFCLSLIIFYLVYLFLFKYNFLNLRKEKENVLENTAEFINLEIKQIYSDSLFKTISESLLNLVSSNKLIVTGLSGFTFIGLWELFNINTDYSLLNNSFLALGFKNIVNSLNSNKSKDISIPILKFIYDIYNIINLKTVLSNFFYNVYIVVFRDLDLSYFIYDILLYSLLDFFNYVVTYLKDGYIEGILYYFSGLWYNILNYLKDGYILYVLNFLFYIPKVIIYKLFDFFGFSINTLLKYAKFASPFFYIDYISCAIYSNLYYLTVIVDLIGNFCMNYIIPILYTPLEYFLGLVYVFLYECYICITSFYITFYPIKVSYKYISEHLTVKYKDLLNHNFFDNSILYVLSSLVLIIIYAIYVYILYKLIIKIGSLFSNLFVILLNFERIVIEVVSFSLYLIYSLVCSFLEYITENMRFIFSRFLGLFFDLNKTNKILYLFDIPYNCYIYVYKRLFSIEIINKFYRKINIFDHVTQKLCCGIIESNKKCYEKLLGDNSYEGYFFKTLFISKIFLRWLVYNINLNVIKHNTDENSRISIVYNFSSKKFNVLFLRDLKQSYGSLSLSYFFINDVQDLKEEKIRVYFYDINSKKILSKKIRHSSEYVKDKHTPFSIVNSSGESAQILPQDNNSLLQECIIYCNMYNDLLSSYLSCDINTIQFINGTRKLKALKPVRVIINEEGKDAIEPDAPLELEPDEFNYTISLKHYINIVTQLEPLIFKNILNSTSIHIIGLDVDNNIVDLNKYKKLKFEEYIKIYSKDDIILNKETFADKKFSIMMCDNIKFNVNLKQLSDLNKAFQQQF